MLKQYFGLQLKMTNRQLTEWGIEPVIGFVIGALVFIGISVKLFEKTEYAEYIYIASALSFVIKNNDKNRLDFIKLCFSTRDYFSVRIIENLIISIAFILFLLCKEKYVGAVMLLILSCLFAVINFKTKSNYSLPTPFSKNPFEFTVGFRANYYVYFLAYFLTLMSINYDNFNLGIFSLIVALVSCLSYYTNTEDIYYVWIFSKTPKEFIKYKTAIIVQYSTVLCLPIVLILSVFYYQKVDIILGFLVLGYVFICTIMLAKYAVFPEKINIRIAIVFALTFWFPLFLLLIIPYLYIQSLKKLKEILL